MNTYTLNQIQQIEFYKQHELSVPSQILHIIKQLAKQVGSPNYNRTPVFPKQRAKKDKYSTEHWEALRNFKEHKIEKKVDPFEIAVGEISSILNKLTNDNYDENIKLIRSKISKITDKEHQRNLCCNIFEIAYNNRFWTELYAILCNDLQEELTVIGEICVEKFNEFKIMFDSMVSVDPEEDYDLFCQNNEKFEKIKSMCAFFTKLSEYHLIARDDILHLIIALFGKIYQRIDQPKQIVVVEEMVNDLCILIEKSNTFMDTTKNALWGEILTNIGGLCEENPREHESLTRKIIFKMEDLQEEL